MSILIIALVVYGEAQRLLPILALLLVILIIVQVIVVVIAVIAILAGVSVGAYFGITKSANDSKLLQEAKTASTVLRLANGYGANYSNKGLTIEELDTLNNEVNRVSGSISYYLTLDINSYSNDVSTIQFVKVDTSLDLNTYDYFRYYAKGDTSRYCLFSLVNESSSLHDNVASVPTTVSEENAFEGELQVKFDFPNDSNRAQLGTLLNTDYEETIAGYKLKVVEFSDAYLGIHESNADVLNLSTQTGSTSCAYVNFEIPNNIKKVLVAYGNYRGSFRTKLEINGHLLSEKSVALTSSNPPRFAYVELGTDTNILSIKTTESNKHASIDYIAFYK